MAMPSQGKAGSGPLTVVPCSRNFPEAMLGSLIEEICALDDVQSVKVGDGGELRLRLHPAGDSRRAWMEALILVSHYIELYPSLHA